MNKAKSRVSNKGSENFGSVKHLNIFRIVLLIGILFVMFYVPYLRGLFFEAEQTVTQIVLLSIFILFWIYKWIKRDGSFIKTPIEYAALALVLVYFITCFTAVSQRLAVSEFLKYVMYFVVFFMISDLIKNGREKKYVLWAIIISALGMCIIGIDSTAGGKAVDILNSVFDFLGLNVKFFGLFVDGRIHSTMQYPNAFASYLMAVFFISIGMTMVSKKLVRFFMSGISFVLLTTFIFTLSRGAYLLLLFAVPLFLLLLPKGSKLKGFYYMFTVFISTGVISIVLSRYISAASDNKFYIWPLIIVGVLISSLFRFTDGLVLNALKKINARIAIISSVVLLVVLGGVFVYVFNASVPLELKHTMDEKDGYIGSNKIVSLIGNKNYRLVFNVRAKSENDKASFAYRIYIRTRNESGITSGEELTILNERFNATEGIEEKEIEFTVPENSEMVSISFQNYHSGTSVTFYDAKILEGDSDKEVEKILLKYKFSFVESILSRFENLTADKSYNTRILFFKDGFKLFKDWWIIGAGGGAWSLLNFKYQSYLYWSTQTHSYPLQLLIETGFVGIIIMILLFISIVISYIRMSRRCGTEKTNQRVLNVAVIIAIMFLFLHSAIDFDFSLSSIYLLAWQLIAVLNSDNRRYLLESESCKANKKKKKIKFKFSIKTMKSKFYKGIDAYPLVMIIISTAVLIYPIKFLTAQNHANSALESFTQNDIDEAIKSMEKASEIDSLNAKFVTGYTPIASRPEIRLGYIDLLTEKLESVSQQTNESTKNEDELDLNNYIIKANELAKKAERHAKYDANLAMNLGVYYLKTKEKEKGIDFVNKSVELKPLVPAQWQHKANVLYVVAMNYFQQGESKKGLEYIEKLINIIDEAKKVNRSNLSPFIFNQETQKYLEKAYYIKSEIDKKEANVGNLIFQSVFEMDVNNDNVPDQWNISDKINIDTKLEEDVFVVSSNDNSKNSYIYTNNLAFEPNNDYRIEVELENSTNIKSIPYKITGISKKTEQLNLNGDVFLANISTSNISENNKLVIYVKDNYKVRNVKIVKG